MECRIDITVSKIWRDGDNVAGTRPPFVEITLLRNGETYISVSFEPAVDASYTFTCLPVWKNSREKYVYTVDELTVPEGYTKEIDGYNVINTINPGSRTITGTKTWRDANNVLGTRPAEITVNLLQNGTQYRSTMVSSPADDEDTVGFSFDDVPEFDDDGKLFDYTIEELEVDQYTTTYDGYNITNTVNPGSITINGMKAWIDDNNVLSTRPAEITINLLQNGTQFDSKQVDSPANEEDMVAFSFEDVPYFDDEGKPFDYTVEENSIANYVTTIDGFNITNALEKSDPPFIDPVGSADTEITGTGISGCEVVVTFPSGDTDTATVDTDGNWTVPADGLAEGDIISAYQRCQNKLPSDSVIITVTALRFSVYYLNNGGAGEFSDSGVVYGTNYRIRRLEETDIAHTGTGFWFSAWNTEPDGSGESYSEDQVIELTKDLILYAQWFVWYNVSYSRNTEAPFVHIDNGRSDRPYTILSPEGANISVEGYDFVSWNTQANGSGTTYNPGDTVTLTGTLRIYAQWQAVNN